MMRLSRFRDLVRRHPAWINFFCFLLLVCFAFLVRTWHYNKSVRELGRIMGDIPAEEQRTPDGLRQLFPLYHRNFAPFTIESAMMFTYAKDIAQGKGVPAHDARLAGMEDLPPYAQMNMGLEWFLGWGWRIRSALFPVRTPDAAERLFQDEPEMAQWMSAQLRLWASLTTGFLFLWLISMRCPRTLSLFGALLHAVSLAAVARSTGQDFVRGEFCIPLFTACLPLVWSLAARPRTWKFLCLFAASFLAFATWDLCQMLFGAWILCELLAFALGYRPSKGRMAAWGVIAAAILANACFVPFHRAYDLIRAPLVWVLLPSLGIAWLCLWDRVPAFFRSRFVRPGVALLVPLLLYSGWFFTVNTPEYASHYSHFSRTMASKLKYRNVKPPDPEMLDYDSRIMWTPSMHSATWEIAGTFFPPLYFGRKMNFTAFHFLFGELPLTLALFYLLLLLTPLFGSVAGTVARSARISLLPFLFTIGFTVGFIYIVRYHEFLILFLCAALPLLVRDWLRTFRFAPARVTPEKACTVLYEKKNLLRAIRGTILFFCVCALAWETLVSFRIGERRYTGDVRFRETAQLIAWFRSAGDGVKGKTVAANFTVGPMLMAYAGTGITMNPQFGLKRIRDITEEYMHALFAPNEDALADYCTRYHVDFVLYHMGTTNSLHPYSVRYIAGAKSIPPGSPANLMRYRPDALRWFCRIDPPPELRELPSTYRVFRFISPEQRRKAGLLYLQARDAWRSGDTAAADRLVREALERDPASPTRARELFCDIHGRFPESSLSGTVE